MDKKMERKIFIYLFIFLGSLIPPCCQWKLLSRKHTESFPVSECHKDIPVGFGKTLGRFFFLFVRLLSSFSYSSSKRRGHKALSRQPFGISSGFDPVSTKRKKLQFLIKTSCSLGEVKQRHFPDIAFSDGEEDYNSRCLLPPIPLFAPG